MKSKGGSGYVGAYNSAELDGAEIKEKKSATGYELYHKDFSSAMQHAYAHAKSKGFVIDPKEIDDKVATGPKKPSSGKVNRYSLKAGRKRVEIQVTNLDNKRYELNMYIEGFELPTFSTYITEGRPKQDPEYVPGATVKDFNRTGLRALADAQKKHYSSQDIKSIARKYKQRLVDAVGGKTWDWEWIITLANGMELTYDYGLNSTFIKGWKFDKKKAAAHLAKYGNEHETVRDMQGGGGKVQVVGLETAFELISEQVELDEIAPWKKGNYTVKDQDGKVLGRFKSGAKAQKFVDKIWDEGDYDSLTVELGEEVVYTRGVELEEAFSMGKGDKRVVDAFYDQKTIKKHGASILTTDGKTLTKTGMGGQDIAKWVNGKIKIVAVSDVKSTELILKYMKKSIPSGVFEEIVLESTKEYAKSLEKIARDRQLKMLTKSERDNLLKIADLLAKERKEEVEIDEAEIATSIGSGGTAGLDLGLNFKKKKEDVKKAKALRKQMVGEEVQRTTFAGKDVFIVDSETYYNCRLGKKKYGRYEKYVGKGKVGQTIREYGLKYPRRPIILQNGESGPMLFLKYGRS